MAVWQDAMIKLATSGDLTRMVQRRRSLSGLAVRFVGASTGDDAVRRARELANDGLASSLFYLGEYVRDPQVIEATVARLRAAIVTLGADGLDVCASVDPTQIGLMLDEPTCRDNALTLATAVRDAAGLPRPGHDALMIDMEDSDVTGTTLRVYHDVRAQGLPVAVTVQAYLHRTRADLVGLVAAGAWVRLVKGAFDEPADIAARGRADRDCRYRCCAAVLLSRTARESGVYPVFATHDARIIAEIIAQANAQGWPPDAYEFEMLYGVRPGLQRELVRRGQRVRVYLPFGTDWFPYAIRRVGESPRNLRFAVRNLRPSPGAPPRHAGPGTVGMA
jgi:proline dehydrogenase